MGLLAPSAGSKNARKGGVFSVRPVFFRFVYLFGSEAERSASGVGPDFKTATDASLQQRLPGAEGGPRGMLNRPRLAALGGPSSLKRKKTDNPREGWGGRHAATTQGF